MSFLNQSQHMYCLRIRNHSLSIDSMDLLLRCLNGAIIFAITSHQFSRRVRHFYH